jgi:ferredoxin
VMGRQVMRVDAAHCRGCGACVDVCPVGAIALMDGKARVDEGTCTGCEACASVCPEGAIRPLIRGELIPAQESSAPVVRQPSPLAKATGAAVAVAGLGVLTRATRAVGRWLVRSSAREAACHGDRLCSRG